MKRDREEEAAPVLSIVAPEASIQLLGGGRILDEAAPRERSPGPAHEPRKLGSHEAADQEHLDGEQREHGAHDVSLHRDHGHDEPETEHEQERLGDGARGLGDDHGRHALVVRNRGAQEPDLDRLAADRAQRGDEVDGFARRARGQHAPVGRRRGDERVAPPQRVHRHDERVRQANEDELPPREPAEDREDRAGPHVHDQHHEYDQAKDEQDGSNRLHEENLVQTTCHSSNGLRRQSAVGPCATYEVWSMWKVESGIARFWPLRSCRSADSLPSRRVLRSTTGWGWTKAPVTPWGWPACPSSTPPFRPWRSSAAPLASFPLFSLLLSCSGASAGAGLWPSPW